MGHTPYGYRIRNGKAVIDEERAAQVKLIYGEYISGTALCASARKAGLEMTHSSVKHLLTNRKYLGDGFYPAIIDEESFHRAAEKLKERAAMLRRDTRRPKEYVKLQIPVRFTMLPVCDRFSDPFEQAEYAYSQIKEEQDGAG